MSEWRKCKIEDMPQERTKVRVRCTAKILGLELTPEWTTEMSLCGMGYADNQYWPSGLHHWDGYSRKFIGDYEWRPLSEGDTDGVTWRGLDLAPCPFTGRHPKVDYTGLWAVAPPNKAQSLSLRSAFVNAHGFTDAAKMRDQWNTRAPDPALATKDATIAELRERLEWQPLDSAPKNPKGEVWGPEILLCTKHGGIEFVVLARYVAGHHHAWLDTNPDSSVGARLGDDAGWMPKPLGPAARDALEASK